MAVVESAQDSGTRRLPLDDDSDQDANQRTEDQHAPAYFGSEHYLGRWIKVHTWLNARFMSVLQ